jgi:hypothetical protein
MGAKGIGNSGPHGWLAARRDGGGGGGVGKVRGNVLTLLGFNNKTEMQTNHTHVVVNKDGQMR